MGTRLSPVRSPVRRAGRTAGVPLRRGRRSRPARREDRQSVGPVSVHSPPQATPARPRGCATDGEQGVGSRRAGTRDDGDEIATEPALRRQQHGLGEGCAHHGVEGVAAFPQCRCPGLGGQRRGRAHDTFGAAAGALLGHHRELGRGTHWVSGRMERARSGCARRATVLLASLVVTPRWRVRVGRLSIRQRWCRPNPTARRRRPGSRQRRRSR